mgnify:FL=1
MGLVPDVGGPSTPISIHSFPQEYDEIMHGVGPVASTKDTKVGTSERTFSMCDSARASAKRQKRAFELDAIVKNRMIEIFGTSNADVTAGHGHFVTDLTDSSLPLMCHNQPLPCAEGIQPTWTWESITNKQECLQEHDLGMLMKQADKAFCSRYVRIVFK